ncbi:hypothetical protein GE21DRAFT_1276802 [Neurospora crassa]|nr:hypothetical protein GE21DRAFT_1276802 [Neurospora crassa]
MALIVYLIRFTSYTIECFRAHSRYHNYKTLTQAATSPTPTIITTSATSTPFRSALEIPSDLTPLNEPMPSNKFPNRVDSHDWLVIQKPSGFWVALALQEADPPVPNGWCKVYRLPGDIINGSDSSSAYATHRLGEKSLRMLSTRQLSGESAPGI